MAQIQELIERALAQSGADGCIVIGSEHTEANLRWAGNNLTTNGQMRSRSITVVSTFDRSDGTSAGVLTRAVSTEEELIELVAASERAARDAGPSDDAAPIVADYEHGDDWNADPVSTDVAVFERFAPELGAAFAQWRAADRLLFGFAEHKHSSHFVATSTGLRRRFDQPDGSVSINAKSPDFTRSAYLSRHTTDFADIDVAALADDLAQRLDWAATRIDLPAGRYETLLPPTTVADLLIYAYWTSSARDAEEGRNAFAGPDGTTRIGERLSDLPLHLYSDPSYPGLECPPFAVSRASESGLSSVFDNGAPAPAVDWMREGSIVDLIRTRSWAATTGGTARPAVENLILDAGGTASLDELVAGTERGLLLSTLWYIREVDPQNLLLTGLTRDGVYLVEDGQVRGAVNNFRFNESPLELLGRVTEAGRTERALSREWGDYFSRTAMPALRVPDFNMSTVSPAS